MKRLIIFLHRYIGIPMSFIFVVWFVSGIVMMYTGDMPSLAGDERLERRGSIDLAAVTVSPVAAAEQAFIERDIVSARLLTLFGRPAYRFGSQFGSPVTVFADNAEIFSLASLEQGAGEVARFLGVEPDAVRHAATITSADQWTITAAGRLPLEQFDVADGRGTRAYFSRRTGEVELLIDRSDRALAWLGAIPHWFYFTPLRTNQPAWYWTVVGVAAVGSLLAILGIILAFTQFRRSKPFRLSASIRYRGLMRWHYYTGALFGLFALTWVFSGLLSMQPFDWARNTSFGIPRDELDRGTLELDAYPLQSPAFAAAIGSDPVYEIDLIRVLQQPHFLVRSGARYFDDERRIFEARSFDRAELVPADTILGILAEAYDEVSIVEHAVLDRYDGYYYAQGQVGPLPVLRVKFDDAAATWLYFDLATASPLALYQRLSRLERWLFNGLHSLDFSFWYDRRPLWDIGMIFLSLGALATSGIGLYLGCRRMFGRPARESRSAAS